MNGQFLLWVLLLVVFLLFLDFKNIPKLAKSMRRMYFGCLLVTAALYIAVVLGWKPPMPTRLFIDYVSPWIFSIVHAH